MMERIDSTLKDILKRMGLWERYMQENFIREFNEEYAARFDYNIEAIKFRKGILTIAVKHPALMNNLMMMKPGMIQKVREKFGVALKDIKFTRMKGSRT